GGGHERGHGAAGGDRGRRGGAAALPRRPGGAGTPRRPVPLGDPRRQHLRVGAAGTAGRAARRRGADGAGRDRVLWRADHLLNLRLRDAPARRRRRPRPRRVQRRPVGHRGARRRLLRHGPGECPVTGQRKAGPRRRRVSKSICWTFSRTWSVMLKTVIGSSAVSASYSSSVIGSPNWIIHLDGSGTSPAGPSSGNVGVNGKYGRPRRRASGRTSAILG